MKNLKSIIGNKFTGNSKELLHVTNKYTMETLCQVPLLTKQEVDSAIDISSKAFESFKQTSREARRVLLESILESFINLKPEFEKLIQLETGKTKSYASAEVDRCVQSLKLSIDQTYQYAGKEVIVDYGAGKSKTALEKHFPKGAILGITPFNFPLNLALHKVLPALIIGASVIIKPSPYTPLSLIRFAKLCLDAGLPAGVFQVLVCDNELSEYLVTHDYFKVFSFTGSDKIGWKLKSLAGKKLVHLELGGNAACIVNDIKDLSSVCKQLVLGSFLYSGQVCISTQRIFIHETIFDQFQKELVQETQKLKSGDPLDKGVCNGPLIDKSHLHRIKRKVESAVKKGAQLLVGGKILDESHNIFEPTILTNVPSSEALYQEEIFGPIVILEKYSSTQEVIDLVNDSKYGLQVGVFSNQLDFIKEIFNKVEVGAVIGNSIPGFRVDGMPYGGIKDSGLGREGFAYTIDSFSEKKLLVF